MIPPVLQVGGVDYEPEVIQVICYSLLSAHSYAPSSTSLALHTHSLKPHPASQYESVPLILHCVIDMRPGCECSSLVCTLCTLYYMQLTAHLCSLQIGANTRLRESAPSAISRCSHSLTVTDVCFASNGH